MTNINHQQRRMGYIYPPHPGCKRHHQHHAFRIGNPNLPKPALDNHDCIMGAPGGRSKSWGKKHGKQKLIRNLGAESDSFEAPGNGKVASRCYVLVSFFSSQKDPKSIKKPIPHCLEVYILRINIYMHTVSQVKVCEIQKQHQSTTSVTPQKMSWEQRMFRVTWPARGQQIHSLEGATCRSDQRYLYSSKIGLGWKSGPSEFKQWILHNIPKSGSKTLNLPVFPSFPSRVYSSAQG